MPSATGSRVDRADAQPVSLSIVIVNWNGGDLLRRCLESITQFPPTVPFEIILVDNGSTDGSVSALKAGDQTRTPDGVRLTLIENEENTGFSKANNLGIAQSKGTWVLLLNPDTEVTIGAIDALIKALQSDSRIGACGPRLLNTDGTLQHSAWRNPPSPWEIVLSGTGLWRVIPRRLRGELLLGGHWDHATRRAVPMLFGAALLVRRRVIETVGALDERFHMYAEDNEWCLRMTRGGWTILFEPDAIVVHHGAHSSRRRWERPEQLRVKLRSSFDFQRYSLSPPRVLANLIAGLAVSGLQRAWRMLRRRGTDEVSVVFEMHAAALKRVLRRES
jgi:N-acetylglucosaminyl-diphospho-decaprenol L-rhamnosyltransferase